MKNIKISLLVVICSIGLSAIAATKTLRIGTEGAYEPFNYINEKGELLGFDVDIAKEVCKELKRECEFVTQAWDGIIPGLLLGKYDAIVASMSVTEQRAKKVLFSDSYYNTPARFVVRTDSKLQPNKESLKGKTVGVQKGTTHLSYMEGEYKGIAKIKEYNTQEEANLDLVAGRLDAVLADQVVLYGWIEKQAKGKVEFRGPVIKDEKYFGKGAGIALRKSDKALKIEIDKALHNISTNGRYDEIRKKYFPFDIK